MGKFIIATFLLLGAAFYEMSGGSDFEPQDRPLASIRQAAEQAPEQTQVSRNATTLITLNPQVTSVSLDTTPVAITPIAPAVETVVEAVSETVAPEITAPTFDLREVSGNRVNMRQGPGTNFGVLDTLPRGTEAEVIEVNADGWARIRVLNTDQIGWMAERLLSDS